MDFETGNIGETPPGWTVKNYSTDVTASSMLDVDRPFAGRMSAALIVVGKTSANVAGALRQSVDAAPYRGRTVLLRAMVRSKPSAGDNAPLLTLYVRSYGSSGTLYPSAWVVITPTKEWHEAHAPAMIPPDAARIEFGLIQNSPGKTNLDNVSLSVTSPSLVGWQAPRALTRRGVVNLHAFARLLGYVRFFHPSDQAASADWNNIAITGVHHVENAPSSSALVAALQEVFLPLAPTLRIYETGSTPPRISAALSNAPEGATAIGWQHHGVAIESTNIYKSERIAMTAPKPDQPFAADIGGGVSILMPTTLYRDANGTLPHEATPPIPSEKPALFIGSGLDRTTRLADVVLSWNVFQHFYPYFEEEPVDWSAVLDATLVKAATDRDETEFAATLSTELAALRDGHGFVISERQERLSLPLIWDWIDSRLVIMKVATTQSELKPGDVIDRIDGRPVADIARDLTPTISAATPQQSLQKLSALMRHKYSVAPVLLQAHHPDGAEIAIAVTPNDDQIDDLLFDDLKPVTELKSGVWYVDLRRLQKSDLDASLNSLVAAKAIVVDMRGYPSPGPMYFMGHLSNKPIATGQFDTPIATLPDRLNVSYDHRGWRLPPAAPLFRGKIVFLSNAEAGSQAEQVLGMVKDNHLGTIVGSATAGVDGERNIFWLPGSYGITWTGQRVRNLDGTRFEGIGIIPDVSAAPTIAGIAAGRDEVLQKGIAVAEGGP